MRINLISLSSYILDFAISFYLYGANKNEINGNKWLFSLDKMFGCVFLDYLFLSLLYLFSCVYLDHVAERLSTNKSEIFDQYKTMMRLQQVEAATLQGNFSIALQLLKCNQKVNNYQIL